MSALRTIISRGLRSIEVLSPIEAAILACLVDGVAGYHSTDPHAVIAAGVRTLARRGHASAADVERVKWAFNDLGIEVTP